jgi:hypothetical protein
MGCAFINNKSQIKINEVDINGEKANPHKSDLNVTSIDQVKSDDIVIIDNEKKVKKTKTKTKTNKSKTKLNRKNVSEKNKSANNLEFKFSGPIITLLRNKVDNHQRKKL